jgi:acyl-CoA hydrolase
VDEKGTPVEVPPLICETDHQKRRFEDAGRRREIRTAETRHRKERQQITEWKA